MLGFTGARIGVAHTAAVSFARLALHHDDGTGRPLLLKRHRDSG